MEKYKISKNIFKIIVFGVVAGVLTKIGKDTSLVKDFTGLFNGDKFSVETIFRLVIMVSLVLAIEQALVLTLNLIKGSNARTKSYIAIIKSLTKYIAALVIICWGLTILGVNVTTVATSVGIVTLVVGFGAESLIEDVITGTFMLLENQYNVGDILEVNGFRGTVTNIGIRTTSITDAGGNIKIINNSNMKDIMNKSNNLSKAVSDIQIPYETDIEAFEPTIYKIIDEICEAHKDVMKSLEYLGVQELGDSGITLRFVATVKEEDFFMVRRIVNKELLVKFKKAGVEVPFPVVDLRSK